MRADVEKQAREEMARKLNALQTKVPKLPSMAISPKPCRDMLHVYDDTLLFVCLFVDDHIRLSPPTSLRPF